VIPPPALPPSPHSTHDSSPPQHPSYPTQDPPHGRTHLSHSTMTPINPNLDMLPIGTFTIHTHPTLHDTTILCTSDGRAVTTLSGPRIRHLFQLYRLDLTHRSFEEEVYHLITRLGSWSKTHSPDPPPPHATNGPLERTYSQHFATHSTSRQNSTQTPAINPYTHTHTTHSTPMKTQSFHQVAATHRTPGTTLK
jgi:hypothetical protein